MKAKKNNRALKMISLLVLTVISIIAYGDSITFTGNLRTLLPEVTLTHTKEPLSDVKEFVLTVNTNAGVCSVSQDVVASMNHGSKPVCKIEWDDPQGLSNYLAGLKGVVTGPGEHTFKYSLKMFDLNTFDLITTENYSVTFLEAMLPDSPTFSSTWQIRDESLGSEHEIFNRNEVHKTLTATVTERNYTQVIKFGDKKCTISQESNNCKIAVNKTFVDMTGTGVAEYQYTVTDPYDHIQQTPENFTYQWDFTPPTIQGVHVNSAATMLPEVITQYGQSIVLLHNQAAVVVESPHESDDPLFYPTDPTLTIRQNDDLYITDTVDFGGVNVKFDLGDMIGSKDVSIQPINEPIRIGKYFVYVYDFSYIQDGLYDFSFSTLDSNGNGSKEEVNDVYVDRNPPDLQFILNGKHFLSSSRAVVYSLTDLAVLAWGGWTDGSKIVSAKLNGESIEFASGTDNVKRFNNIELPMGSSNSLEVTAEDAVGNSATKIFDFQFGKYEFKHTINTALSLVEPINIDLRQSSGLYCVMFANSDLAQLYSSENSSSVTRGCTVEWLISPPDIDISNPTSKSRTTSTIGSGYIANPGTYNYHFKVISYSANGSPITVYEAQDSFDVLTMSPPILFVGSKHIYENYPETYKYSLANDYNLTVRFETLSAPKTELVVELYDELNNIVESKHYETASGITRTFFRVDNNLESLTAYEYKVRAYYKDRPDLYVEKPYHFYTIPGFSVRLYLEHPSLLVEGGTLDIKAKIGQRSGDNVLYEPGMGIWSVGLYRYDTELRQYVLTQDLVQTDETGIANITLDSSTMIENENRLIAIAKLVTPYPEVESKRNANSLYTVPVMRPSGISSQLTSNVFSAPVPARFITRLEYETQVDKNTAGEILWQSSVDGNDWLDVARKTGLNNYIFNIDEPAELFVRAMVENKLNQEVYYTNTIKFVGYEEAVLTLTGDHTVASGAMGRYSYSLNEYGYENMIGSVEWSTDAKGTWSSMTPDELLQVDSSIDIYARALMQVDGNEPYYIEDKLTVNVIPPRKLSSLFKSSTNKAEVGDTVNLTANFVPNSLYSNQEYKYLIYKPDGTTLESLELEHTLIESDFLNDKATFLFRSWVDGMELQTVSTLKVDIKKIVYTSLPPTSVELQTPERVNYSDINLRLNKPSANNLPSSVVISQDIILPTDGELELKYVFGSSLRLVAKQEGIHPIKIRFYDNRGNEREHIVFVTVIAPPPLTLDISTNYFGKYMRPPMRLTNSLRFKFGSPNDRLDHIDWFINDELIETDTRTIKAQIFTEPGDFKITAKLVSEFGQTGEVSENFTLVANKPPVCEPYWETRDRVSVLFPNCKDFDGKIMRVEFYYAYAPDVMMTVYRYFTPSVSFIDGLYDPLIPVTLTAIDDSDAETTQIVSWPEGE